MTVQQITMRRGTAIVLLAALSGACSFDFDGDGGGGGGCGGTPGELGRLTYRFEQAGGDDLSAASGQAFAVGTDTGVQVEAADGEALPALAAESSDPSVLAAAAADDPDYPHRVTFRAEGTAKLRMREAVGSRAVVDEVSLRVAVPDSLGLLVGTTIAPLFAGAGMVEEPDRVALRPGAECRLFLHLLDADGNDLFGRFLPTAAGAASVTAEPAGMIAALLGGAATFAEIRLAARTPGEDRLRLAGPGGVSRELDVEVRPDILPASLEPVLWPGYVLEFEAGETSFLSAQPRTSDGTPLYGAPLAFRSEDPEVASVEDSGDPALVRFLAPGAATLVVRSAEVPGLEARLSILVVPPAPAPPPAPPPPPRSGGGGPE